MDGDDVDADGADKHYVDDDNHLDLYADDDVGEADDDDNHDGNDDDDLWRWR